jgi:hypothetical protein
MDVIELLSDGNSRQVPQGDAARQAVDSLRGYAYQITAAALAWLDLDERSRLFLEVAEDYAVVAGNAMEAVQVKDTNASGTVTLNTNSVREAISNFVSLTAANPKMEVQLRYFTTSEVGVERAIDERPGGMAGLAYWRNAATAASVGPLRSILESDKFSAAVQKFVKDRDDLALRSDMLRKIYWDCGKPDIVALRKEFEERLIVVGREVFNLTAPEAARIADVLLYHVLEKSVADIPADRVLTRANFYAAVDQATRIFVPRAAADMLALISSGITASALTKLSEGLAVNLAEPGWLVRGEALPQVTRMVPRLIIETNVLDRMHQFGASIIVGASGLGKSSVARAVAEKLAGGFVMIDFRNADAEETCSRLDAVLSLIGGLHASTLIFEDLNNFNDPLVAPSTARVFEALRRRDRAAIVTCYLSPVARALSSVGLDVGCSVECPYFAEEEASALVELHGGDPKLWGRLAYVAGAFGHPQLVYAFISGMRVRGWPRDELVGIVGNGLSTGDIEAEREAARRTLVAVLPKNARKLLYRLSLTIGRFDRAMALTIANVPPQIVHAGECMDALIGPWLETIGHNKYRISPLAARSGQEMMLPAEKATVHSAIATQFMVSGTVNGSDADIIFMHALLGKNEQVLVVLARSIVTSDERTLEFLATNLTTFKLLGTDKPLYQDNPSVSALLRLAQFKLLVKAREADKIAGCAAALFLEAEQQPHPELCKMFRALAFGTVLGTMGIANYLDNWLDLLEQFRSMTEANEFLASLQDNFQEKDKRSSDMFGALFAIGSASLLTVARLEILINQLDELEPARRAQYFSIISADAPDYSVFINSAWTSERPRDSASAADAAERYLRMAIKTAPWMIRPITDQCWIAQAVMLDEYAENSEGALKVLDEAVAALGDDVLLSRARAKVYWRAQDHERALSILRRIADEVGRDNSIERAFALREAAISAAKSGEWALAETWFLESKESAAQSNLPDMTVMAIGLGADASVAALKAGHVYRALKRLSDVLKALADIDPESSLRAAHCHHLVRHAVLWVQTHIDKRKVMIGGEPIAIEPGCCSNPDPQQAIKDRPLAALDLTWYLLAESEITSGHNAGISEDLCSRLIGGPIPVMEIDLCAQRLKRSITDSNAINFACQLWSYIEAIVYLSQNGSQMKATFDVLAPTRGNIPSMPRSDLSASSISSIASDALFAYAIVAACKHSAERLSDLQVALLAEFGTDTPSVALLARANATYQLPAPSSFDEALIDAVRRFRSGAHVTPQTYCWAAIKFFQQTGRSNFKGYLIPIIAAWQRDSWTRIVVSETFRLSRPQQTVPAIKAALSMPDGDERFLGTLFLATANATGLILQQEMQTQFGELAVMSGD